MDKQTTINELKQATKLVVTLSDFGRSREFGSFPYFNLFALNNDEFIRITGYSPYWNSKKRAYGMTVWGMDRVFELIYTLGVELGLSQKEIDELYRKTISLF